MTQKEKIELLKNTISFLYEKEGRSKSYISRLLDVDRKILSKKIIEWNLTKANISYMTPSTEKFLNKNKQLIISRLNDNIFITEIARELNVDRKKIYNIIEKDKELNNYYKQYQKRMKDFHEERIEKQKEESIYNYSFEELDNEIWKEIMGYDGYYVSNMGRIKKYVKTYDTFILKSLSLSNVDKNRYYVSLTTIDGKTRNLQVARLVGFAFVEGYSEEKNTINHIDKNTLNNMASNLEWVSQSENNKHAYDTGRSKVKSYQKNGKFKKIILNDTYEFKTIKALAKFCGVSETQMQRYISNECKHNYKIEFIY